jgi:hypothetical protein
MKRREFFQRAGVGSAALVSLPILGDRLTVSTLAQAQDTQDAHNHGPEGPLAGPLSNATVGFGAWRTDFTPPVDRYINAATPPMNAHHLLPFDVTIKAGGSVNFIISGLHQIIVYAPGTKPEEINTALTRPTTGIPAAVPLINDPRNRLYAGPDPSSFVLAPVAPNTVPRTILDRSEVVHFPNQGLHLVICGVLPHFLDGMIGYVRVLP